MRSHGTRGLAAVAVAVSLLVTASFLASAFWLASLGSRPPTTSDLQVTSGPWTDTSPTFDPDGLAIAFVSNRSGSLAIWTAIPDGRHTRQLTFMPGDQFLPSYSPDGKAIAFLNSTPEQTELWVTGSSGTGLSRLSGANGSVGSFSWSPNGKQVAYDFLTKGKWGIWLVNSDGGDPKMLTDGGSSSRYPSWDQSGHILYSSDRAGSYNIWEMNQDGTGAHQVTQGRGDDTKPRESPDGKLIAYVSYASGQRSLWVVDAAGGNPHEADSDPPSQDIGVPWTPEIANDSYPDWNQQSDAVIYYSDRTYQSGSTDSNVFVFYHGITVHQYILGGAPPQVVTTGDSEVPVIFGQGNQVTPAWSPDGRSIIYSSDRTGHLNIWIETLASATPKSPYGG